MGSSRRDFLVGAAAGVLYGCNAAPTRAEEQAADPEPCPPDAWTKHGVVLRPEEPWEHGYIQNFNSTAEPLEGGRWRLWYGVNPEPEYPMSIAIAEGAPGEKMVKHQAVLSEGAPEDAPLAIGNLPKGWNPVQPVHLRLKDGRHRLYFWAHRNSKGPPVVQRFLAADSADGRRYRVIDPLRACLYTRYDDYTKALPPGVKLADVTSNDGATVYQLPDGTFEMYVQELIPMGRDDPRYVAHDNLPGRLRVIDRLVSKDGLTFTDRRRILVPDKQDPVDTQFYYFTVTHTDRGRVGLLGQYLVKPQYMDLQWCFSSDGISWRRLRQPWIPRGKPGEPDCYSIYPPNSIVQHDGRWWLFYTGVNYSHNMLHSHGPKQSCVMWATTPSIWKT